MKKALLSLASLVLSIFTISLQLKADSVLTTIAVGNGPSGIAANPRTNRIYVGVSGPGQVAVIDGKTQQVIDRIDAGGQLVALNVITNRIYSSRCDFNTASCNIAVINGNNDKVVANIPIASGSFIGLQGLAVDPVLNRIYASDADNSQYIVIDGKTNTVVTMVPVSSQPAGIAVNPATNRVYVVGGGFPGEIVVFDADTNAQLATIPEDFGVESIVTNFRLDRIYVTQAADNTLIVADGAANQNITQIPTGQFPDAVDVNLINAKVYVTNGQSASVTIIDGNTNQVLQTLSTPGVFPNAVAVNLATGFTYISVSGSDVVVLQPN